MAHLISVATESVNQEIESACKDLSDDMDRLFVQESLLSNLLRREADAQETLSGWVAAAINIATIPFPLYREDKATADNVERIGTDASTSAEAEDSGMTL